MDDLAVAALVGFAASMVDGALGMGFGPTSSSLLLASGMSPVTTSVTVNIAKLATGVAGAVSHWKFRNIDRQLVLQLAIPGAIGAIIGTVILSSVDGDQLRPALAIMLFLVGARILVRFSRSLPKSPPPDPDNPDTGPRPRDRKIEAAGLTGGVTNGLVGAWGPIVTPFLLQRGTVPRIAVGSVNTAEVVVAVASVGSILGAIGGEGFQVGIVVAMLIGGVVAAPLGAYAVRFVPARALGIGVGGILIITQLRELNRLVDIPFLAVATYVAAGIGVCVAASLPRVLRRRRRWMAARVQRGSQASLSSTSDRTSGAR